MMGVLRSLTSSRILLVALYRSCMAWLASALPSNSTASLSFLKAVSCLPSIRSKSDSQSLHSLISLIISFRLATSLLRNSSKTLTANMPKSFILIYFLGSELDSTSKPMSIRRLIASTREEIRLPNRQSSTLSNNSRFIGTSKRKGYFDPSAMNSVYKLYTTLATRNLRAACSKFEGTGIVQTEM